ncbi:hypothetical protein [uncultured Novosphingobium sp.]|uniref:hypothetical protein n=1 Tax=uncultured Novosphingobium sp. TaxID=292277 RepID=UPI00259A13C0|nr:hypothetical protein [uncultured Novosphingobium sp.]
MRDVLAFITLMACLTVLVGSLIALVRPIPQIGLGSRKRALGGIGVAFALFVVTAIVIPAPKETHTETGPASEKKVATGTAPAQALNAEQESVVSFMRYAIMQNLLCRGEAEQTQDQIDKVAAGRARVIDAYDEAKRAIRDCGKASAEFARPEVLKTAPAVYRDSGERALKACRAASEGRGAAMQLAQKILDGDDRLASASKYKELLSTAKSSEATCRMELLGMADSAKIPDEEVDFAQIR